MTMLGIKGTLDEFLEDAFNDGELTPGAEKQLLQAMTEVQLKAYSIENEVFGGRAPFVPFHITAALEQDKICQARLRLCPAPKLIGVSKQQADKNLMVWFAMWRQDCVKVQQAIEAHAQCAHCMAVSTGGGCAPQDGFFNSSSASSMDSDGRVHATGGSSGGGCAPQGGISTTASSVSSKARATSVLDLDVPDAFLMEDCLPPMVPGGVAWRIFHHRRCLQSLLHSPDLPQRQSARRARHRVKQKLPTVPE